MPRLVVRPRSPKAASELHQWVTVMESPRRSELTTVEISTARSIRASTAPAPYAPSERHALLGPTPGFRKASTLG